MKYVLMKKCCQNIHILNSMILQLINIRRSSSYKVVMYIQNLHHFCNMPSPDDGPKSDRKYLENK